MFAGIAPGSGTAYIDSNTGWSGVLSPLQPWNTAMSESQPTPPQPPAELHWGISYLREDLQDLRRDTHADFQELRHEIRRLDARIDEKHEQQLQRLDNRFLWMVTTMIALTGVVIAVIRMG
jgi:hypothetical protein